MTIDNGPPEIPYVCPEQIAMALALFRAAVLDETVIGSYPPAQRSRYWSALLEPDALRRGIGVIRIHFEFSDSIQSCGEESSAFSNC